MILLPEILRHIFREATAVPLAFEYPLDDPELREPYVDELISESLATKCALSMVSKLFHHISSEFLYEIIILRQYEHIQPLVEVLRRDRGARPSFGWWCRRLEVRLRWNGRGWTYGCRTLWGLLPSCPNIIDLRCNLIYLEPGVRDVYGCVFPPSEVLLQALASYHKDLQNLEFSPTLEVPVDLMHRLLRHLPELRACIFGQILPSDDGAGSSEDTMSSEDASSPITSDHGDEEEYEDDVSVCEDPVEAEEFEDAKGSASWPRLVDSADGDFLSLPRLQGLWLCPLDNVPNIFKWSLPALRKLVVEYNGYEDWCTEHLTHTLSQGPNLSSVTIFTFRGPPIDIWPVVELLPKLASLAMFFRSDNTPGGQLSHPHRHLACVTVFRKPPYELSIPLQLQNIYDQIQSGTLPALRCVRLWGHSVGENLVPFWRTLYDDVSINLEIRTTKYPFKGYLG